MRRSERPKRPYRNLEEYRRYIVRFGSTKEWPCLECRGCGRIYDPDDPPCPIEGNKLRNRIKCPKCKGSGEGSRKEIREAYKAIIDKWKQDCLEFDRSQALRKSGLAKLTTDERKALGIY
jgi:hypothetical protein